MPDVTRTNVAFLPVNLYRDADLCISFAEDTDISSFGNAQQFHGTDGRGAERYLARMWKKMSADPESCLHAWLDGEIVGQMNLATFVDPSVGYISVFYVAPAWRGKGIADMMEEHAVRWFQQRGFAAARLSVVPTNVRAVRFYQKHGWQDLGPRPDKPDLHNMEKRFCKETLPYTL